MKNPKINKSMKIMLGTFVALFALLGSFLLYTTTTYGEEWFSSPYNPRISATNNVADAGTIYDRNGLQLAWSVGNERMYAENEDMRRAVSHIVGDVYGKSMGAETYFAKYLYGYDQSIINRFESAIEGSSKGADIYLTIDAQLSEYIYDNMGFDGAVVLMNYKTGEVLSSVSVPTFNPMEIADLETEEEGSQYLNRVLQGRYPPGSTMKIVTTAAAIENGLTNHTINCDGHEIIDGQEVTCPRDGGHGEVGLQEAFEESCNIYYAELSVLLGANNMLETADETAFNYDFSFTDFNMMESSFETGNNDGDLAWAGIGQYKDLITPMHNMLISAGVANDGVIMEPKTLLDVTYGNSSAYTYKPDEFKSIMSESTAQSIAELMRGTVEQGTATSADIGGIPVNGKTGTAEFSQDGEIKNHSWFVGYSQDENHPLAIAVILEGAGFGSAYATPLAGEVLAKAVELGY